MIELIIFLERREKIDSTFSKTRKAFTELPTERQIAMIDGKENPLEWFDIFLRRRNGSTSGMSLSDVVKQFNSMSEQEQNEIIANDGDRNFPTINE